MQIGGVSSSPENYLKVYNVYQEFYRARSKNAVKGIPWVLVFLFFTAYIRLMIIKIFGNNIANHITDFYRQLGGRSSLWTKL